MTHVLDKGASVTTTESVLRGGRTAHRRLEVRLGHRLPRPRPVRQAVAARRPPASGPASGGTLLEIAWCQGKERECLDWALEAGFGCVEVSRGVATMPLADKHDLIRRAAERFVVLSEVGSKDPQADLSAPASGRAEVAGDLAAGARWVIAEGRESGTVGPLPAATAASARTS